MPSAATYNQSVDLSHEEAPAIGPKSVLALIKTIELPVNSFLRALRKGLGLGGPLPECRVAHR